MAVAAHEDVTLDFHFDPALTALFQVILIDITLAGDNAIVIGMVAATVPPAERRKIIFWGLAAAVVLRIGLATVAVELLTILGLAVAGGLLLLWVAWRLYRETRNKKAEAAGVAQFDGETQAAKHKSGHPSSSSAQYFRWLSPISRCRSTTCSVSPAPRATIYGFWS